MSEEDVTTIVIDYGSNMTKAGFSGDEAPRSVFPTVCGFPKFGQSKDVIIGDEALSKARLHILKYQIERGIVQNWDNMEKIISHTFHSELRADPKEHPVLLTEPVLNPKSNREKMIQTMFEMFEVPSFYVACQPALSLYGSGRTTALILECGDGVTQTVPFIEGNKLEGGLMKYDFGGHDLTEWMYELLRQNGQEFITAADKEFIRDIKERFCYVALDYDEEMNKAESEIQRPYEFPCGDSINIGTERFRCSEILFKPSLYYLDFDGIDTMVFNSINKCNEDFQVQLFNNIVISGGTSMLPGFKERLEKELTDKVQATRRVKVLDSQDPKYAVWIGGSILASLETFPQMLISKKEYEEIGPRIVHLKCN